MANNITWDGIFDVTMKMPGITVDRVDYLTDAFKSYGDVSSISTKRPIDLFNADTIEKVARDAINGQTLKVTSISTLAGIPGGPALFGTIPADLIQYYYHVIILAQKLGYIYGWPDLRDEDGSISEGARNVLTVFIGVMLGAQTAEKAIGEMSKRFAVQVAKRIPKQALMKTSWYPIIKQIGKWMGIQITRQSIGKGLAKVIPILGGFLSGGFTFATFRPMAGRLRKELRNEMEMYKSNSENYFYTEYEDVNSTLTVEEFEELRIKICINVAKIDFEFTDNEKDFLIDMIECSGLANEKKQELISFIHNDEIIDVNLSSFNINKEYACALIESLLVLINLDSVMNPAEKQYLIKIAKELGITDDELEEMILASRGV